MEGITSCLSSASSQASGSSISEGAVGIRAVNSVKKRLKSEIPVEQSIYGKNDGFCIKPLRAKSDIPEEHVQKMDWSRLFYEPQHFPEEVVSRLEVNKSIRDNIYEMANSFEEGRYRNAVDLYDGVINGLNGVRHSGTILKYIHSINLMSQINLLSDNLEELIPGVDFPVIPGVTSSDEYINFFLNLAEAAKSGSILIDQSSNLEWFCYRKATAAGNNQARNNIIIDMLFGEVDEHGDVVVHPRCDSELLEHINQYVPEDGRAGQYEEVISQLQYCMKERNHAQQVALCDYLSKDPRQEVKRLAPMVLLEPMFGSIDTLGARKIIEVLRKDGDTSVAVEYWRQLTDLLDGKKDAVSRLLDLGEKGGVAAYSILLRHYRIDQNFLTSDQLIKIYEGEFTYRDLSPELASMMLRLSYFCDRFENFRNDDDVQDTISRVGVFVRFCADTPAFFDGLYDSTRDYFSALNSRLPKSVKLLSVSKDFKDAVEENPFLDGSPLGIFIHAHQVLSRSDINGQLLYGGINRSLPEALYWMIVLDHCTEDLAIADLVHSFLEESRGGIDCLIRFVYTSSISVFLKKIYQYGIFSELSKSHPIFEFANFARMLPDFEDRVDCLDSLVKFKELNDQPDQAVECLRVMAKIRGDEFQESKDEFNIFRRDAPAWKIRCCALLSQPNHPIGDTYRFNEICRILEDFNVCGDLDLSCNLILGVMDRLDGAKQFLSKEVLRNLFIKLGCLLEDFKSGCSNRLIQTCESIISWLDQSDSTLCQVELFRGKAEKIKSRSEELARLVVQELSDLKEEITKESDSDDFCQDVKNPGRMSGGSCPSGEGRSECEFSSDGNRENELHQEGKEPELIAESGSCSQSSDDRWSDDEHLPDNKSEEFFPVDPICMIKLREETDPARCLNLLKKLIPLDYSNTHEMVEQAVQKLDPKSGESIALIGRILEDVEEELNDGISPSTHFNSRYVVLLQQVIDQFAAKKLSFPKLEGILYQKLSYMALFDLAALKYLYFGLVENPPDYYGLLELMASALERDVNEQLERLATGKRADARALLAFTRAPDQDKSTSRIRALQPEIDENSFSPDRDFSVQFMRLWLQHDHAELRSMVEVHVRGSQHNVSKASAALWIAYEFGVISAEQHTSIMMWIDKRSPEYYFHSLLTENDPDASIFIGLQSEHKLAALTVPQLETVARKLVEVGRLSDAQWLARTHELSAFEGVLSLSVGSDGTTSDRVADDLIETPVEKLIAGAKSGHCQAQCKLVEWILAKHEQWNSEPIQHLQNICSFSIHAPSFLTDSCRLLYQGIALCAGVSGHKDPEAGKVKIRTALDSHDPTAPLILHKMISRFPWLALPYSKEDLLRISLENLPEAEVGSAKLMTEILLVVGEAHFRQVVKEIAEEPGVRASPDSPGSLKAKALSCWFDKWSGQVRMQKLSPVERVLVNIESMAKQGWPEESLSELEQSFYELRENQRSSDHCQRAIISVIKRLPARSQVHQQCAENLLKKLLTAKRPLLLQKCSDGLDGVSLSSPIFDSINRYELYCSLPEVMQKQLAGKLAGNMVALGGENYPFQVRGKLGKPSLRLMQDMVQVNDRLLENEFTQEMTAQRRDRLHKERKDRIWEITHENAECQDMLEAMKLILYAHKFDMSHRVIEALRTKLMPFVTRVLNGQATQRGCDEVLAAAVISLRAF